MDSTADDNEDEAVESSEFLRPHRRRRDSKTRPKMDTPIPLGVRIVQRLCIPNVANRMLWYRIYILIITFVFYASYHLSRRPLGIVRNALHQNCSGLPRPAADHDWSRNDTWCDWEPFDRDDASAQELFSWMDFTYWLSYAVGMFFVGHIAERTNLRNFLALGMIVAGLWTIIFGMAFFWRIHSFSYFVAVQIFAGIFQATGWPAVVTLIGNWFGKKRLGLIFGVWNSHTSVGNILGAVIAGIFVETQWGYSFVVPGLILIFMGIMAYLFVIVRPEDVGLSAPDHVGDGVLPGAPSPMDEPAGFNRLVTSSSSTTSDVDQEKAISFWRAVAIPGVVEFSICLFFAKAVSYTFLVWLPKYIKSTIDVESSVAAELSTVFDAGGIVGGILAGQISDTTGGSATVCGVMFIFAAPSLYLVSEYGGASVTALIILLIISGLLVNGPYALITTAVSADLGTHPSLTGNAKALATVTAIIDGTGSLGAAFGPLIAGLISVGGWQDVFYFLMTAQIVALVCLARLIFREVRGWVRYFRLKRGTLAYPVMVG